jgi:DNA-binding transcriptional MocR family regulator
MRKKYKEKQDAVLNVFRRYEEKVEVSGDFAGFYVIARAKQKTDEAEILREAQKQGIYVRPLSVYYQTLPEDYMPSFLVGFAGAKINELEEGAEIFCRDIL